MPNFFSNKQQFNCHLMTLILTSLKYCELGQSLNNYKKKSHTSTSSFIHFYLVHVWNLDEIFLVWSFIHQSAYRYICPILKRQTSKSLEGFTFCITGNGVINIKHLMVLHTSSSPEVRELCCPDILDSVPTICNRRTTVANV